MIGGNALLYIFFVVRHCYSGLFRRHIREKNYFTVRLAHSNTTALETANGLLAFCYGLVGTVLFKTFIALNCGFLLTDFEILNGLRV